MALHPMNLRRLATACIAGIAIATLGVWALADPPKAGYAPDPPVHVAEKQWVFELGYTRGASVIERVRQVSAKKPTATARVMGRYALELWVGKELLDRVRFDVPLLGDDERERDPKRPFKRPTFNRVTTKIKVQMADHPRTTVLAFVDRATGDTRRYFWPPDEKGQLEPFSVKSAIGDPDAGGDGGRAASDASDANDGGPSKAAGGGPSDAALVLDGDVPDAPVTAVDAGPAATSRPAAPPTSRPAPR